MKGSTINNQSDRVEMIANARDEEKVAALAVLESYRAFDIIEMLHL